MSSLLNKSLFIKQKYRINLSYNSGGTASSSYREAFPGQLVTINIYPNNNYEISNISSNISLSGSTTIKTFIMPYHDVSISISFKQSIVETIGNVTVNLWSGTRFFIYLGTNTSGTQIYSYSTSGTHTLQIPFTVGQTYYIDCYEYIDNISYSGLTLINSNYNNGYATIRIDSTNVSLSFEVKTSA